MSKNRPAFRIISFLFFLFLLLAGPLIGVLLRGGTPAPYFSFPPVTTEMDHASFSWIAFIVVGAFVLVATWPFWRRLFQGSWTATAHDARSGRRWPWWGWAAALATVLFWVVAWNRFDWMGLYQRYTYFPLWLSFIILLNALAVRMSGQSLMTHRPLYFTLLFPSSAAFWWAFEYLNRFVGNWHYSGTGGIGGWQYFAEASVAFSTVLPAVMSMRFILLQMDAFARDYRQFPAASWLASQRLWILIGLASFLGLIAIGWIPTLVYPLVWVVPGLLWVAWQRWSGYVNPLLKDASQGDLTLVWTSACAALLCGFFWEMWNMYSLARWEYSIPYLEAFHIFEMPLLGYAGYLPFGIVCALVANSLLNTLTGRDQAVEEELDEYEMVQR